MTKQTKTLVLGISFVLLAIVCAFIYFNNQKFLYRKNRNSSTKINDSFKLTVVDKNSEAKTKYTVDLDNKIIYPYIESLDSKPREDFTKYQGIPKEETTATVSKEIIELTSSIDSTKHFVSYVISDLTLEQSDVDGSYPVISSTDYICDSVSKVCTKNKIIEKADKLEKLNYKYAVYWHWWDSQQNIMMGTPLFNSLLALYDINNDTYRAIEAGENEYFRDISVSPSMQKILIFKDNKIILYNQELSPLQEYDYPQGFDYKDPVTEINDSINYVIWSADENIIYIATNIFIYSLDLTTDKSLTIYQNNHKHYVNRYYPYNLIESSGKKYLVFIDYEDKPEGSYEKKSHDELNGKILIVKAINLRSNKITEITRGDNAFSIW